MSSAKDQDDAKEQEAAGEASSSKIKLDTKIDMINPRDWLKMFTDMTVSKEKPVQLLESLDIEGVANYIKTKCKNVITMVGAGISTSAGIPDFRSPGTGLYDNLQKYDLPDPQAIFNLDYMQENPEPFFLLAKHLWPGLYKPTLCHYFVKMLETNGVLLRHYTQNIDTLDSQVGIDEDKIVEAHGSFRSATCLKCKKSYKQEDIKDTIMAGKVPRCSEEGCDGIIKPDIVFFGEKLPDRFVECVNTDMKMCDMLIIMGTSLCVQPFASLMNRVPDTTPRLYINQENSNSATANPLMFLMMGGGFQFDTEDNYRDVFLQGSCDEGCQRMADLLGWGKELKKLVTSEHASFEKKNKALLQASGTAAPQQQKQRGTTPIKPATNTPASNKSMQNPSQSSTSAVAKTTTAASRQQKLRGTTPIKPATKTPASNKSMQNPSQSSTSTVAKTTIKR